MKITEDLFLSQFKYANEALDLVSSDQFKNVYLIGVYTADNKRVTVFDWYTDLYKKISEYYLLTLKPLILDCEYSAGLFNFFIDKISKYGVTPIKKDYDPREMISKEFVSEFSGLATFNNASRYIAESLKFPDIKAIHLDQDLLQGVKIMFGDRYLARPITDGKRKIPNSDEFAKQFFKYSSFFSLLESTNILFKSFGIKNSDDELLKINDVVSIESDYARLVSNIATANTYAPLLERIWSYGLSIGASKNHPFADVSEKTTTGSMWLGESAIESLNNLLSNRVGVTLHVGDNIVKTVYDSHGIEDIFRTKNYFFNNFCQTYNPTGELKNYYINIIKEKHNLIFPIILNQFVEKVDAEKRKYKTILKVSDETINKYFFEIDKYIEDDKLNGYIKDTREYADNYFGLLFGENIKIFDSESLSFRISSYDSMDTYLNILLDLNPIKKIVKAVQDFVNSATTDSSLDLLDFIISACESDGLRQKYGEKIDKTYLVGDCFIDASKKIRESLSLKAKFSAGNHLLYFNNEDDVVNFDSLEENYKKIESESGLNYYSGAKLIAFNPSLYNAEDNEPVDDAISMSDRLNFLRADSRLKLIGNKSYKEFVGSLEKGAAEGLLAFQSHEDYIKNKDSESNIIKILSHLTLNSFKEEGQSLSKSDVKNIEVKYLKEDAIGETRIASSTRSFSELALIINQMPETEYDTKLSYTKSGLYHKLLTAVAVRVASRTPGDDLIVSAGLFWLFELSNFNKTSSIKEVGESIDAFIQNLPIIIEILSQNEALKRAIRWFGHSSEGYSNTQEIIKAFISQSRYSKIETFKNLSSLINFYHNNNKFNSSFIINSKHFSKLYLKGYQTIISIYLNLQEFMKYGIGNDLIDKWSFKSNIYSSPKELKDAILKFKNELTQDPDFGPEKTERLFPESKINLLSVLDIDSVEMNSLDLDRFIDKMISTTSEKYSNIIPIIDNLFAIIKQIKDIREYIGYAKPKDEKVLSNNYAFSTGEVKIRFRTFDNIDPQHFSIGAETDCCQRVGGVGSAAAIDSFINPLAGVIVMEVFYKSEWTLASQSYFHYVPKFEYIILDNIEAKTGNFTEKTFKDRTGILFRDAYAILAKILLEKGFKKVLCGKSFTYVINEGDFENADISKDPRHFEVEERNIEDSYTDFDEKNSFDLGKPQFDVSGVEITTFAAIKKNMLLIKISNMILKSTSKNKNLRKLGSILSDFEMIDESNNVLLLGNV